MKVAHKQLIFKLSGKFEWKNDVSDECNAILPDPRNIEYSIVKHAKNEYRLYLYRLSDRYGRRHGINMEFGPYSSLEEAKNRAEIREARYEVKKATRERKGIS